ncbi:MAG: bifunctional hydroxymethylpyrimidine kinase/phosphomethylpyrimidine kinase [Rickettsiales bacterium]|nr:bifunctional hydroxymethylpyrimidine kinase/phosphomethylpyrimidine kinase [Rickettsiales bacterium]
MSSKSGRVLTIAGSDSSGGAGIQADIKTITALGGYAASALTALTAQNTQGVDSVEFVKPEFMLAQAESVLSDIGADCIKTGMLANSEMIESLVTLIKKYKTIPIIVDPVMVSTSGDLLLEKASLSLLTEQLFPLAMLVTPNIPEAELLAHILISSDEGMIRAGKKIIEKSGCKAVLVKGGHLKGDTIIDILVTKQGDVERFTSPRIDSKNTHGTGCTLASAIATRIALGETLTDAIKIGRDYVKQAIHHAPGLGKGHGPLGHGWTLQN